MLETITFTPLQLSHELNMPLRNQVDEDQKNEEYIARAIATDDIQMLHNLKKEGILDYAIYFPAMSAPVLRFMIKIMLLDLNAQMLIDAITEGSVEKVTLLIKLNCPWSKSCWTVASAWGDRPILHLLRQNKCPGSKRKWYECLWRC